MREVAHRHEDADGSRFDQTRDDDDLLNVRCDERCDRDTRHCACEKHRSLNPGRHPLFILSIVAEDLYTRFSETLFLYTLHDMS